MQKTHLATLTALLIFIPNAFAQAAPPKVNFHDMPGYRRALNLSKDPAAKAIRQEIADGPAALAHERALAKQEGLPIVPADLREPLPPPDQNAALIYDQIAAQQKTSGPRFPDYADSMGASYAYTPEQIAIVQKIYDSHLETFRLLHQATDMPQCVFTHDWSKIDGSAFPQFQYLRNNARMLATESYLLAIQGHYNEAVTNEARGFRLAQHTASTPKLLPYLVGLAISSVAYGGMESILDKAGPNAEVAMQVQQEIKARPAALSLRHALIGEIAVADLQFNTLRHAKPSELADFVDEADNSTATIQGSKSNAFTSQDQLFVANLLDAAEADYIHQLRLLIAAADLPPLQRRITFGQVNQRYNTATDNPIQSINSTMLALLGTMDQADTRNQAREEIVLAGAEVLKQKALTGVFPNKLPDEFTDPFSNKPLGYRREVANGFVVYSTGIDGKFDGGKPGNKWNPHQDIFRYPIVPIPVPADELQH